MGDRHCLNKPRRLQMPGLLALATHVLGGFRASAWLKLALARAHDVRSRDAADPRFWVQEPGLSLLKHAWAEWVSELHRV